MKPKTADLKKIPERSPTPGRVALLAVTAVILTALMTTVVWDVLWGVFDPQAFQVGQIAKYNIRAPRELLIEDVLSIERQRTSVQNNVPKYFRHQDTNTDNIQTQLNLIFESLSQFADGEAASEKSLELTTVERETFERQFRVDLIGDEWNALLNRDNWSEIERILLERIQPFLEKGVVANRPFLERALATSGVVLVSRSTGAERVLYSSRAVVDLNDALEYFKGELPADGFRKQDGFDSLIAKLGFLLLKPNVFYDATETEARIQAARDSVSPIFFKVRRGEVIVRKGETITSGQSYKLQKTRELFDTADIARNSLGYLVLTLLIIVTVYLFTVNIWPRFKPKLRDLSVVALTLVGSFFLIRGFTFFGYALSFAYPDINPSAIALSAPLVAGGILLEATMGASAVFLFTMTFALLAGVFLPDPQIVMLLVIMGNFVGAVSVQKCTRRSVFLIAGTRVALINMIIVLCFILLQPEPSAADNALKVLCAVAGGIMSGILGFGLTPVAEYIGSYITNIKLMELASLDRPLLRELSVQAPGTWNHSMVMGQMAEAASNAIGANSLLTRVGAYYHDIGKIKKPSYFTENQSGKKNPHDKLTPSMSALIIQAHVKDGVEMARQHKLPEQIIDFIPQHHGTALIEFFFNKAQSEAEENGVVHDSSYRYGGPKPQTREAGILMLADGIEASCRTISDPTPAKIQGLVQKMTNKIFSSGELEESDLTLRDLHLIAKSFTRVLAGIHHRRIQYAEPAEKVRETNDERKEEKQKGETIGVGTVVSIALDKVSAEAGEKKTDDGRHSGEAGSKKSTQDDRADGKSKKNGKDTLKRLGI